MKVKKLLQIYKKIYFDKFIQVITSVFLIGFFAGLWAFSSVHFANIYLSLIGILFLSALVLYYWLTYRDLKRWEYLLDRVKELTFFEEFYEKTESKKRRRK